MLHWDWLFLGATYLEATVDIVPQGHGHQYHLGAYTEGLLLVELDGDDLP